MTRTRAEVAAWHHALGDAHRLAIVEHLELTDATPGDLARAVGLSSNLLAFHLEVLEGVGLVARHRSQGDGRRRYVTLGPTASPPVREVDSHRLVPAQRVVFVCTHNSARSQLAAAIWARRTGRRSWSAGSRPARRVNPHAVDVAAMHGLDIGGARPRRFADVEVDPDLVVTVCDRVREEGQPFDVPALHWSVPEPGSPSDFPPTFRELVVRVDRLADRMAA